MTDVDKYKFGRASKYSHFPKWQNNSALFENGTLYVARQ